MASEEQRSAYACPDGLDPCRWCDVELRHPDMWGELRCQRCGWCGADIPQDERYQWFSVTAERSGDDGR